MKPWEIDELTAEELDGYLEHADAAVEAARRRAAKNTTDG